MTRHTGRPPVEDTAEEMTEATPEATDDETSHAPATLDDAIAEGLTVTLVTHDGATATGHVFDYVAPYVRVVDPLGPKNSTLILVARDEVARVIVE